MKDIFYHSITNQAAFENPGSMEFSTIQKYQGVSKKNCIKVTSE